MRDTEFYDPDRDPFQEESEEVGLDIWQRLSKVMVALLFLCVLAAVLRLFIPEIERRNQLQQQAQQFEQVRMEKKARVARLQQKFDLLKNDREYLEAVARDRLDLAKEGEYIIRLERADEKAASAAPGQ